MTEQRQTQPSTHNRWAPWWVYLLIILGANYLRQVILPFGTVPEWADVIIALSISGTLFVLITALHRTVDRRR